MKADMPFTRITKVIRYSNAYYLFLMLLVFSLMYWHAAWNKPFHVDEFYSWVYSYRCTFSEIMMMKDAGIGHPPLYHLLQKVVQTLCTDYHFLQVRLVNYIAAIFYIVSLAVIIYRSRKSYLLCLGVCLSATVFELFLFSRMYGVLSLMALWAYILAEKYINTGNNKYMLLLLLVVVAGFFSDYNFVLVVPCVVISLLWRARHGGKIIVSCFVLAAVLLISASLYRIVHSGVQTVWGAMRFTASDTARALLETAYLILNFSFKELIALSCVILV
ncbi:MAG TPA: glycosyltransferase family 39 protein, partial [Spirochaetota bacterium]|nr:glycosyltransferase family 39 protein [Spirochaetota bacterium]